MSEIGLDNRKDETKILSSRDVKCLVTCVYI